MNKPFRIFSSPSNKIEAFLSAFFNELPKLTAVNLLFVLTSLPLITLVPSLCGLHGVCKKAAMGEETRAVRDYFFFFASAFKHSLVFEAVLFPLFFLSGFGAYFYIKLSSSGKLFLVGAALCFSAILFLLLFSASLPEAIEKKLTLNEAFLSFASSLSKNTLKLALVFLTVFVPVLLLPYTLPVLALISFSLCSLLICCID